MGNFYENLNTGLEKAVPLAMKKFELDNEVEKWRAQQSLQEKTFGIANAKWQQEVEDQRRLREFGDKLKAGMGTLEGLKAKLPGIESQMTAAGGGDVDVGADPEKYGAALREKVALTPQLAAAEEQLSPERLIMGMVEAHPEKGMPGLIEMAREKASAGRALTTSELKRYIAETALRGRQGSDETSLLRALIMADTAATRAERTGATKTGTWVYDGTTAEGFPMYHNSITGEPKVGDQKISAKPRAEKSSRTRDLLGGGGVSGMPDPAKYKDQSGTDTATGKRYKSNGTEWVEIK